jgi:hypothetical protein
MENKFRYLSIKRAGTQSVSAFLMEEEKTGRRYFF